MFTDLRHRRQLARITPGDGSPLPEYRFWQLLSRTVFRLDLADPDGEPHVFEVDVRYGADGHSPAVAARFGTSPRRSRSRRGGRSPSRRRGPSPPPSAR